jgi:hypothetical protein
MMIAQNSNFGKASFWKILSNQTVENLRAH